MTEEALEERRRIDRERYKKKKEKGEIKTITDYTPREQRQMRKLWREKAKKKREKEKMKKNTLALLDENTPPSSPSFSRVTVGKVVAARNRRKIKAENIYLKSKVLQLESKLAKYRMRFFRLSKKISEVEKTTKKPKTKADLDTKKAIHDFLLQDEHSRLTSGKKETITRNKVKKQIRYLNDSLLNLHKIFKNQHNSSISYETFRRYRPFWVLFPKASSRNTFLCSIHSNNYHMIQALHSAKIIPFKSSTALLKSLCCNNSLKVACLERRCPFCQNKKIDCFEYEDNDTISYRRWITKNITVVVKGQSKVCKRTVQETVRTTNEQLIEIFDANLPKFMQHVANIISQAKSMQIIKEQMSPSDGLLHMDFSENYNCKYSQEIQSAHFGGSKPQISLHTCVYYSTELEPPENYVKTTSICTVSADLRHDPVFICCHLKPVLNRIKKISPYLKHLHILSDGPTTQYRNKSMFYLIPHFIEKQFQELQTVTWHFSEAGHGKGAPDGVGGCIKRICDASVAKGHNVSCFDELILCAQTNCKGIEVYQADEAAAPDIQKILEQSTVQPFRGTFKIHQLSWSVEEPTTMHARRLSCMTCAAHVKCPHFEIGQIDVQNRIPDSPEILIDFPERPETPQMLLSQSIVSTPESPDLLVNQSPSRHSSPELFLPQDLGFPYNRATPDASTVPNTPSPPVTPEAISTFTNHDKPVKKRQIISSDSDDSDMLPHKRQRKITSVRKRVVYSSDSDDSSEDVLSKINEVDSEDVNIF